MVFTSFHGYPQEDRVDLALPIQLLFPKITIMFIAFIKRFIPFLAVLLCFVSSDAFAYDQDTLASEMMSEFDGKNFDGVDFGLIFDAANYLFWSLALIGLVWNFVTVLLRRGDLVDWLFEIIRFLVFTGLFFWLLKGISESGSDTFLYNIFDTFAGMGGDGDQLKTLKDRADDVIHIGLVIFNHVLAQNTDAELNDALISAGMSLVIIVALTLVSAQVVLVVIMAWMLAYGGIFLLGFGGSRWTSPIAISYYKHALAVGIALLALIFLMKGGGSVLYEHARPLLQPNTPVEYPVLANVFVIALLMAVLAIKLPGLLYTLVTGSPLGLLAGTASMAGTAIVTGGRGAITSASHALAQHTVLAHTATTQYATAHSAQYNATAQHSSTRSEHHHNQHHYASAVATAGRVSYDETVHQTMNTGGHGFTAAGGYSQSRMENNVFGGPPPVAAWSHGSPEQSAMQPGRAPWSSYGQTVPGAGAEAGDSRGPGGAGNDRDAVQRAASVAMHGIDDSVQRQVSGTGPGHAGDRDAVQRAASAAARGADDSIQRAVSGTKANGANDRDAMQRAASAATRGTDDSVQRAASGTTTGQLGSQPASASNMASAAGAKTPGKDGSVSAASSVHTKPSSGGFQPAALQRGVAHATGAAKGDHTVGGFQPGAISSVKAVAPSGASTPQAAAPSTRQVDKTVKNENKKKVEDQRKIKRKDERKDKSKLAKDASAKDGNARIGTKPAEAKAKGEGKDSSGDRRPSTTDGGAGDDP